jgi:hypothetical protein
MRAKMKISGIQQFSDAQRLTLSAVGKDGDYPEDGWSEDNTFAKWTPQADMTMTINNPALLGQFEEGQKFYIDFTRAE